MRAHKLAGVCAQMPPTVRDFALKNKKTTQKIIAYCCFQQFSIPCRDRSDGGVQMAESGGIPTVRPNVRG